MLSECSHYSQESIKTWGFRVVRLAVQETQTAHRDVQW